MFSDIDDLTVRSKSFDDPSKAMTLEVDAGWVRQNARHARIQPLFDFWALVKGEPPPINCIGHHEGYVFPELSGMWGSHALFRGLKRPVDVSDEGDGVYVFLSMPPVFYRSIGDMVCLAKLRDAPKNAVFACYVRRYEQETEDGFSGRVVAWEWVRADQNDPNLPADWQERYEEERWKLE